MTAILSRRERRAQQQQPAVQPELPASQQQPAVQPEQPANIASADQQRAALRTELVKQGLALIGPGLTAGRILYGLSLHNYLAVEQTVKSRRELLAAIVNDIIAGSKGMLDERKLNSCLKLYYLSVGIPSLSKLNYRIAELFEKIGSLSFEHGIAKVNPDTFKRAETLITNILAGTECCNDKGIVNRKDVSSAIDAITGKQKKKSSFDAMALLVKKIAGLDEAGIDDMVSRFDEDTLETLLLSCQSRVDQLIANETIQDA